MKNTLQTSRSSEESPGIRVARRFTGNRRTEDMLRRLLRAHYEAA